MSVGVPALDTDHRCLIRIINVLDDVRSDEAAHLLETVLETLLLYGRYHFAREENVMARCGFPDIDVHRQEHEGFTRHVRSLLARYRGRGTARAAHDILDYLSEWLRHHILIQDMAFKPFITRGEHTDRPVSPAVPWDQRSRDADVESSPVASTLTPLHA